jgi:hypothetical protein
LRQEKHQQCQQYHQEQMQQHHQQQEQEQQQQTQQQLLQQQCNFIVDYSNNISDSNNSKKCNSSFEVTATSASYYNSNTDNDWLDQAQHSIGDRVNEQPEAHGVSDVLLANKQDRAADDARVHEEPLAEANSCKSERVEAVAEDTGQQTKSVVQGDLTTTVGSTDTEIYPSSPDAVLNIPKEPKAEEPKEHMDHNSDLKNRPNENNNCSATEVAHSESPTLDDVSENIFVAELYNAHSDTRLADSKSDVGASKVESSTSGR